MAVTTLDAEKINKELPPLLERAREVYNKKLVQMVEFCEDIAKQSGAKTLVDTVADLRRICDQNIEMMNRVMGSEGDSIGGDGTLWGAVGSAKTILKATGGDI